MSALFVVAAYSLFASGLHFICFQVCQGSLEVCRVCLQVFRLIQLYQPTYCGQPVQQTCFLFVTNNGRATKPGTISSVPRTLFPCDSGHCACHILWRFVGHHTLSLDVSKMCTTIVYLAWRSGAHLDSK